MYTCIKYTLFFITQKNSFIINQPLKLQLAKELMLKLHGIRNYEGSNKIAKKLNSQYMMYM